jgi:hypothetical protein
VAVAERYEYLAQWVAVCVVDCPGREPPGSASGEVLLDLLIDPRHGRNPTKQRPLMNLTVQLEDLLQAGCSGPKEMSGAPIELEDWVGWAGRIRTLDLLIQSEAQYLVWALRIPHWRL